jgi:uncharacterized protein YcfL
MEEEEGLIIKWKKLISEYLTSGDDPTLFDQSTIKSEITKLKNDERIKLQIYFTNYWNQHQYIQNTINPNNTTINENTKKRMNTIIKLLGTTGGKKQRKTKRRRFKHKKTNKKKTAKGH